MQRSPLPPAMYHGANSFAKEIYRETISAGVGCNNPLSNNRSASEYGRWQSHPPDKRPLRHSELPPAAVVCRAGTVEKGAMSGL
jgi:hypothetical protein